MIEHFPQVFYQIASRVMPFPPSRNREDRRMNLPNASNARVEREKVVGYLLNSSHPYGSGKAGFFARFGFVPARWESFAEALRQHGSSHPVSRVTETGFGPRYAVEGSIITPDGRNPNIRTVWQMDHGELAPRLITAYPLEDSI